ncbi:MAG TPA: nuclear transport factor 2 family protein [Pyrinomonadaceae bacterium]|nr:nuclear transport factor 2 family protein [Pyrinomonadaceae bacterium]
MKKLLIIALLLINVTAISFAQTVKKQAGTGKSAEEILIANERASWEAVRRKDYQTFESFLADDFYDIFPNGQVVTRTELMQKYIRGVDLMDYSLSDFKVVMLNKDAAIVVYTATARGSESQAASRDASNGKVIEIHAAVTSGWARRGRRWLNVFYREHDIK